MRCLLQKKRTEEADPLMLPRTHGVGEQLRRGGHTTTFSQIADGILERLAQVVEEAQQDEIRFVRDCLCAGPARTNVPCLGVLGSGIIDSITGITEDIPVQTSKEIVLKRKEERKEEEKEKAMNPPRKRKDAALRGCLASAAQGCLDVTAQGVPWLGEPVNRWPVTIFKNNAESALAAIFEQGFDDWQFDIFKVASASDGHPLLFVGWETLRRAGCFFEFNVYPQKVAAFLQVVESKYALETQVAYHNALHAADVTQSLWSLMSDLGAKVFLDPMDILVSLISAISHDVGHDGFTNGFHSSVEDKLSLRYNDRSILENFHASTACKLFLVNAKTNFLSDLPKEQRVIFRKECIDMILSTDMAVHFKTLSELREHSARCQQDVEEWAADEAAISSIRNVLLHCADISNQAKPMTTSQQWTRRVLKEFFDQGDKEASLGLPISPLCNRNTVDVGDSQAGFIGFIVRPLFELLAEVIPRVGSVCVDVAAHNQASWKAGKGYAMGIQKNSQKQAFILDDMSDQSDVETVGPPTSVGMKKVASRDMFSRGISVDPREAEDELASMVEKNMKRTGYEAEVPAVIPTILPAPIRFSEVQNWIKAPTLRLGEAHFGSEVPSPLAQSWGPCLSKGVMRIEEPQG
eukprot:TRINITY_DN6633_c0_g1_i2.p1 TRINITY_DN6633_c0_g1~~TRINITY_DN6633_c0_g1_i2.p1  ORF type:complete len:635 (+),score=105.03 TRINITY_DN6633_c0_g1_i2:200-2104(+)